MKKQRDIAIYEDERYYAAFPSIVRREDGELLLAFRRAPERRWHGGKCTHADPNSQLVLVRSGDGGETWTTEPELIHAHSLGGSQDPCMTLLPDGTILCASYLWILQQPQAAEGRAYDGTTWEFTFGGGYLARSRDGGRSWRAPILPPAVPGSARRDALGRPVPAYNRGNILVGSDALLYWAVVRAEEPQPASGARSSVHLMVSADGGDSWEYRCPIAADDAIAFNETYLYETERGDLVAFLRTGDPTGTVPAAVARSRDRGRSFEPWTNAGFVGHPHCAARLNDGRVLLAYGYRREPYGIRARVLDADCSDPAGAPEIVLRDDGGSGDLGYPWIAAMPDGRALVVYYFNRKDDDRFAEQDPSQPGPLPSKGSGLRHIAGTWLEPTH